jgi:hypothetical protein
MDRNDKQNRNHLGGETKTMDKTEQIKRRNLIIRDIESKEFELNMHRWACSTNSGMPLTLSDIKDRSLCNTALCIAGDASRRLIIGVGLRKALVMAQKHLGNLAQDEFFLLGATYLGLNAEEAEKLFFTTSGQLNSSSFIETARSPSAKPPPSKC